MLFALPIRAVPSGFLIACIFNVALAQGDGRAALADRVLHKSHSTSFVFLDTPVKDEAVKDFVSSVRQQLKKVKSPASLPQREAYVKELSRVLDCCVVKDWMRYGMERPQDKTRNWISEATAASVIRLLGNLDAVEAVESISQHFLVSADVFLFRASGVPDVPTMWALFEIGEASLPVLRKKMTSDSYYVRVAASETAAYILGPRAETELLKWIDAAESEDQRNRLRETRSVFKLITANAQAHELFSAEQYRTTTLERDRRYLDRVLNRPLPSERFEEKSKHEPAERKGGEKR